MTDLALTGLDGSNPLGFIAALGVLDAVAARGPATLRWQYAGVWKPVLTSHYSGWEQLLDRLEEDARACATDAALALSYGGTRDLKPPPTAFRTYLLGLVDASTAENRLSVDWAASFATDVATDNNGNTKPTALHFTAGKQKFLEMAHQLLEGLTRADLEESLKGPWTYSKALPVMGWDATSAREYALRATDPSTDKKLGVPGADWLALRGLRFLPTTPRGGRVHTTCCSGGWKSGSFTWPLWTGALTQVVIRSLLSLPVGDWSAVERRARGVGVVFASDIRRSDQGGYGSFSPSVTA